MKNRLEIKNSFDGNLTYGSKNFNLKTGRDVHLKNRTVSHDYYSKKTNKIKPSFLKDRKCPLCNNNNTLFIFNKSGFNHVRCKNCDLVYVNPILKEERLHNLYLNEDSYNKVLTNELQIKLDKKRFNYNLDIIDQYMNMDQPGKLLDIGAGPGTFVDVARERGWESTALEFNSFCVKRIESLGIKCINEPIEKVNLPENSFDCITLWTVLEHLQDPSAMLKQINYLLKPNGILAILVPNMDSLVASIMHEKCGMFSGDAHINHFNNDTLTKIQEMNGFRVLESETIFSEINIIKNYLNFQDPYFGNGKQDYMFLDPKFIHDNLLGYLLTTYAKKS